MFQSNKYALILLLCFLDQQLASLKCLIVQNIYLYIINHVLLDQLINLNPGKYNQGLHHYPFLVKADRCSGSCNTFNDFSNSICSKLSRSNEFTWF